MYHGVSLENQCLEDEISFQQLRIFGVHLSFRGCSYAGEKIRHSEEEIGDGERVGIRSEYYWPQKILHCGHKQFATLPKTNIAIENPPF